VTWDVDPHGVNADVCIIIIVVIIIIAMIAAICAEERLALAAAAAAPAGHPSIRKAILQSDSCDSSWNDIFDFSRVLEPARRRGERVTHRREDVVS
jgi:hypothetical protein